MRVHPLESFGLVPVGMVSVVGSLAVLRHPRRSRSYLGTLAPHRAPRPMKSFPLTWSQRARAPWGLPPLPNQAGILEELSQRLDP
jgi:hypothetical protein